MSPDQELSLHCSDIHRRKLKNLKQLVREKKLQPMTMKEIIYVIAHDRFK